MIVPIVWIAQNTVMRTLRMKATYLSLILISVLLFIVPHTLISDGTVYGEVQIFLVWSMGGLLLMLSLYNLLVIITQIREDMDEKQILLLDSTPLPRWGYIVGRLLGVTFINAVYIAFALVVVYTTVMYKKNVWEKKYEVFRGILEKEPSNEEAQEVVKNYQILVNDVLSARDKYADFYNVDFFTEEAIKELKAGGGRLPEEEDVLRQKFREFYSKNAIFSVEAQSIGTRPIIFADVPPASDDVMFYSFSYQLSSSQQLGAMIEGDWVLLAESDDQVRKEIGRFPVYHGPNQKRSIRFTTQILKDSKKLYFSFINRGSKAVYGGIKSPFVLLVPSSTFEMNLVKAGVVILIKAFFVSVMACLLAVLLSYSVSVFLGINLITFFYTHSLLAKSIRKFSPIGTSSSSDHAAYFNTEKAWWSEIAVKIFPDFTNYLGDLLVNGENITYGLFAEEILITLFLRSGILLFLVFVIYHFIELAIQNSNELIKR